MPVMYTHIASGQWLNQSFRFILITDSRLVNFGELTASKGCHSELKEIFSNARRSPHLYVPICLLNVGL